MTSVLVVEDDDAIRGNVARLLGLEGFEVSVAVNGSEGLDRARALRPDVMVSDVHAEPRRLRVRGGAAADRRSATTAVLVLTALDDRAACAAA